MLIAKSQHMTFSALAYPALALTADDLLELQDFLPFNGGNTRARWSLDAVAS